MGETGDHQCDYAGCGNPWEAKVNLPEGMLLDRESNPHTYCSEHVEEVKQQVADNDGGEAEIVDE